LDPERRRALHRKVAAALDPDRQRERATAADPDVGPVRRVPPEVLAHHYLEGGLPDRAARLLLEASERAALLDAGPEALHARDLAARAAEWTGRLEAPDQPTRQDRTASSQVSRTLSGE
jgi:hypothetical protein